MAETVGSMFAPVAALRPELRVAPSSDVAPNAPHAAAAPAEAAPQKAPEIEATKLIVSLDAETKTFVYKSVSPQDGEIVWQWPSESVLRVIQYFRRIEHLEERNAARQKLDTKL